MIAIPIICFIVFVVVFVFGFLKIKPMVIDYFRKPKTEVKENELPFKEWETYYNLLQFQIDNTRKEIKDLKEEVAAVRYHNATNNENIAFILDKLREIEEVER